LVKLINNLRAGDNILLEMTFGLLGTATFVTVIGVVVHILTNLGNINEFVPSSVNPGWNLLKGLYEDPLALVSLRDCKTKLYAGVLKQSLKSWEQRNQPNPKDRCFLVDSRPELYMRRNKAKYKTKDHVALAGLPYTIKKNGATSTEKSEEKIDGLMDVVQEIVNDKDTT
jgi:hypothetical protein